MPIPVVTFRQPALARSDAPAASLALAISAALVAAVLLASPASATMYKWVDADGRVVYSDQPPPDRKVDKVIKRAPPPDPTAAQALADLEKEVNDRAKARADAEAKAGAQAAESKSRAEECAKIRAQAELLNSNTLVYRTDAKGQRAFLDEAEHRRAKEEANALLKQRCG